LKKKGQPAEADKISGVDTEVLITSYIEDKVKAGYLILVVRFMYVFRRSCLTP